jgi:hypothetical protein
LKWTNDDTESAMSYRRRASDETLKKWQELESLVNELSSTCLNNIANSELLRVALFDRSIAEGFSDSEMANCLEILRTFLINESILFLHRAIDPDRESHSLSRVFEIINDPNIKRIIRRHCVSWELNRDITQKGEKPLRSEVSKIILRMKIKKSRKQFTMADARIKSLQHIYSRFLKDSRLQSMNYYRNSRIAHRTDKPRILKKALKTGNEIKHPRFGDIFDLHK